VKEKLHKKEVKIKELWSIIEQLNKSSVKYKVSMPTNSVNNFLSPDIIHSRTQSSSGGFNLYTEDCIKKQDENVSLTRIKEANDDLISQLSCVKDTLQLLKVQPEESNKQITMSRLAWKERELTLASRLRQLKEDNKHLKTISEENTRTIKALKEDCEKMQELYEKEETRDIANNKEIKYIKNKLNSTGIENTGRDRILRERRSVDKGVSNLLKINTTVVKTNTSGGNRIKTPHVKVIGKEMIYNPSDNLFL
jgi:hypothetical protein